MDRGWEKKLAHKIFTQKPLWITRCHDFKIEIFYYLIRIGHSRKHHMAFTYRLKIANFPFFKGMRNLGRQIVLISIKGSRTEHA